jgi:hypothetical protein
MTAKKLTINDKLKYFLDTLDNKSHDTTEWIDQEQHQEMIDAGFYDLTKQDLIHILGKVKDEEIQYKIIILLRELYESAKLNSTR